MYLLTGNPANAYSWSTQPLLRVFSEATLDAGHMEAGKQYRALVEASCGARQAYEG